MSCFPTQLWTALFMFFFKNIYVVDAIANVLDTHIIFMTKKIQIFDNFFQQIARPIIFISPHTAYRAFCGLIKIKFETNLWKIIL